MKNIFLVVGLIWITSLANAESWGEKITLDEEISMDNAVDKAHEFQNRIILVSAKIDSVCPKKGCWMTIKTPKAEVRVTFKDYSFFVPQKLMGKNITMQGVLSKSTTSIEDQKHYLIDAGKTEEAKKITSAKDEFKFLATGVVF